MKKFDKMDDWQGSQLNEAKEILAFELTQLIHGEEEAQKAKKLHMPFLQVVAMTPICRQQNLWTHS